MAKWRVNRKVGVREGMRNDPGCSVCAVEGGKTKCDWLQQANSVI